MGTTAGGGIGDVVSFKANGDLSDKQYCGVRLTAANTVGTVNISGTDLVIGILQGKPEAANSPADVQISGITKVVTSAPVTAGNRLVCGTDARFREVVAADTPTNTWFTVVALETATTTAANGGGDIISALIKPTQGTIV